MRIVSGKYRGRRITPPKGMEARPTTDYAREGLFNILQHSVPLEGITVLDLFAGTGAVALEFLSRGAEKVLSVDHDRELFQHQQRMARELGEANWHMVKSDVFAFLNTHSGSYDVVFADPPFTLEGIERVPQLVQQRGLLASDGLLIVEHSQRIGLKEQPGFWKQRPYGAVHFSFFKPVAVASHDTDPSAPHKAG